MFKHNLSTPAVLILIKAQIERETFSKFEKI